MLCFVCIGSPRHYRILLIEETIRYSAYRQHGVQIGANVVVSVEDGADGRLCFLHRRALDDVRLATLGDWQNGDACFPYTHTFSHVIPDRIHCRDDGRRNIQLAPGGDAPFAEGVQILAPDGPAPLAIADALDVEERFRPYVPCTCLQLHGLPQTAGTYLFRIECKISEPSFGDLISEDHETGTRIYKVYGPDHIRRHIETVDIPRAQARCDGEQFGAHVDLLAGLDEDEMLTPSRYGIIAVDNPNCNPAELEPLNLTDDLQDITSSINGSVYEHPVLDRIRGRLHWFMCDTPSSGFFLQLAGPIALTELCEKSGAANEQGTTT